MTPVFLAGIVVERRRCVVFGGDHEAAAKVRSLSEAGGDVEVVAREVVEEIAAMEREGAARWRRVEPDLAVTAGAFLVVSTIRDESWSRALFARATGPNGFLVCCLDQPAYCTFTNVASVRRGPLQIGIGTNGAAPMLAARLRQALEAGLDDSFARFVERIAALREETHPEQRRDVIAKALEGFGVDLRIELPPGDAPR